MAVERLEGRILFSAPTQFASRGVGGGGALFSPSFSPVNPSELYVVTDMSELFHSTNLGQSWTFPDFRQIQGGRNSQVQFTSNPNILYTLDFTENAGVVSPATSTDAGQHWSRLAGWANQVGNDAYSLYADPNHTNRLIANDYYNVWFSNDSGQTWAKKYTTASGSGAFLAGVFWDPNGQNIYVGTNQGLLVSSNGGSTFAISSATGIPAGQVIESFAGAEQNGTTRLYAVTWNSADVFPGMFVEGSPTSYQNTYKMDVAPGANWTVANTGIGTDHPFYVAATPTDINTVYLGGTDSTASNPAVEKSTNGGGNWSDVLNVVNNGNVVTGWQGAGGDRGWGFSQETLGFAVSPTHSNILAFTDFGFVHLSTDGGKTWQQAYVNVSDQNFAGSPTPQHKPYHGIGLEDTSALWMTWSDASNVFLGYTDINGARSTDAGSSWAFPNYNGLSQNTIYQISRDASTGNLYAASSSIHDIYQSTHLTDSTIDSGKGRILYSTDKGADWLLLHDFGHPVIYTALDPTSPTRMYASVVSSTAGGIYVTNDLQDGANSVWTKLTAPPRTQGHAYNIDVLNDGTLVVTFSARRATVNGSTVFTNSSGVFVSTDHGQTWADRTDPNMVYWTKDLTIDPTDPTQNTWYASVRSGYGGTGNGFGGLYKTTSRGVSWARVFTSLGVESSAINAATGEMYVSTTDSGLYYSPSNTNLNLQQLASYPFRQPERIFVNPFNNNEVWVTSFGYGTAVATASPLTATPAVAGGAAQRSEVKSLTVAFNRPVTLSAGAITLTQRAGFAGDAGGAVPLSITTGDNQTYTLTFTGASGPALDNASLPDGVYDLVVHASLVKDAGGQTLAGGDQTTTFHRLFGDTDGNASVNALDYAKFKQAFGVSSSDPAFNAALDFDGNGSINALDYAQFKKRFGTTFSY